MMSGELTDRGLGFSEAGFYYQSPDGDIWAVDSKATVAGIATVAGANAAGMSLVRTANPYGVVLGVSILLVPDVVWFNAGYSLFD